MPRKFRFTFLIWQKQDLLNYSLTWSVKCLEMWKKKKLIELLLQKASFVIKSSEGKRNKNYLYFNNLNVWILPMSNKLSYCKSDFWNAPKCPAPIICLSNYSLADIYMSNEKSKGSNIKARKFMEYICQFWTENTKFRLRLEKGAKLWYSWGFNCLSNA